jgi:hypothetical protein
MPRHQQYDPDTVARALTESRGLVGYAATRLGCRPVTVREYIRRYALVREAFDTARNQLLDLTELRLVEGVQRGEAWAIKFILTTVGASRGYGRQVVVSAAGTPQHLRVTTRPVAQIVDDEDFQTACQEAFGVVTVIGVTRLLSTGDDVWGT